MAAPHYDRTVNTVLQLLEEGKSKEETAQEAGYDKVKSMDQYLRRKGFKWDSKRNNYVPKEGIDKNPRRALPKAPAKVAEILDAFEKEEEPDPKAIAQKHGFKDHKAMAEYLASKGYFWEEEKNTYVKKAVADTEEKEPEEDVETSKNKPRGGGSWKEYLPLLEMLQQHYDKLEQMLNGTEANNKLPRYAVPGRNITKAVSMTDELEALVNSYSREKNIKQKEIFEMAIIEFLQKYGYSEEVRSMLERN